jgi:hypothetical protein
LYNQRASRRFCKRLAGVNLKIMAKRKNYYQVHKNKSPKKRPVFKLMRLKKYFYDVAKAASKVTGALISLEYSMTDGAGKIGQLVCFIDSPGGST